LNSRKIDSKLFP